MLASLIASSGTEAGVMESATTSSSMLHPGASIRADRAKWLCQRRGHQLYIILQIRSLSHSHDGTDVSFYGPGYEIRVPAIFESYPLAPKLITIG